MGRCEIAKPGEIKIRRLIRQLEEERYTEISYRDLSRHK